MALATSTYLQVLTGGSDTANSGGFNVLNANFPTDGAATVANTSSPVFSSASYNFTSSDVGARIYIKAGASFFLGWFTIASVASNKATLSAAVGTWTASTGFLGTTVGCSNSTSPTGATWGIDYSQQASARITFSDLVVGATTTKFTSVLNPVGVNFIGNLIVIISTVSGTPTAGRYEVVSTSTITATCDRSLGTAASVANAGLGGALATPGQASAIRVAAATSGFPVFVGPGTYTCTTSTANVAGGVISDSFCTGSVNYPFVWEGWSSVQGDGRQSPVAGTPVISAGSLTSVTIMTVGTGSTKQNVCNLTLNGNNGASNIGIVFNGANGLQVNAINCKGTAGIQCLATDFLYRCTATGCSGTAAFVLNAGEAFECEAYANTTVGFAITTSSLCDHCISSNNTGASSYGFNNSGGGNCRFCVAYANGSHGFYDNTATAISGAWQNCISEGNSGFGFACSSINYDRYLFTCATYNNTSGTTSNCPYQEPTIITQTAGSYFVSASTGNFALNNTAGQGALLRAAGYPGLMPRGTTTAYTDIGAAQHQDSGTGAITLIETESRLRMSQPTFRHIRVPIVIPGPVINTTTIVPVRTPCKQVTNQQRIVKNRLVPIQPTTFSSVPVRTPPKQVRTLVANRIVHQVPIQVGVPVPIRTPPKQVRTVQTATRNRLVTVQPTTFRPIPVRIPNRQVRVLVATNHIRPVLIPTPAYIPVRTPGKQVTNTRVIERFRSKIVQGNVVVIPRTSVKRNTERVRTQPRNVIAVNPPVVNQNIIIQRPIIVR
jgi:hypothetical protein